MIGGDERRRRKEGVQATAMLTPSEEPKRPSRRRWLKHGIAGGIGLAVIVGTFVFVLPQFANYRQVWDAVKDLSWWWVVVLLATVAVNMVTFAPPWMAALPGLRFVPALKVTQASTASTYLAPGGPAVGVGLSATMLLAWGFTAGSVTLAVTLTSVWNQLSVFGFPVLAFVLLTFTGHNGGALQTVGEIGAVVFVVIAGSFAAGLASGRVAARVGSTAVRLADRLLGIIHKGPVRWDERSFVRFRNRAVGLLRRRWHVLTLATIVGQLSVFLVMLACLRALGVGPEDVDLLEAFAAWSLARVIGSIPITPGGLGLVELGLATVLVGFGGNNAAVVAAVLLYRFLTIVPTLVLGAAAGATWRRHRRASAAETA